MEETTEYTNQEEAKKSKSGERNDPIKEELIAPFDSALGKHIERLLGTRQGIDTLPINLFTVSCLVLLAARETEIESFHHLPPERYNHEKLLEELSNISIQPDEDLESGIQDMIKKGYIEVADDGRFFAGYPTIRMAKLIDHVFPTMPGLNLVAYLGQMIDEAMAGRKEIEVAVSQFNQMLGMHGVPVHKEPDRKTSKTKQHPYLKVGDTSPRRRVKRVPADHRPANIFSKLQTKAYVSRPPEPDLTASEELTSRDIVPDNRVETEFQQKEGEKDPVTQFADPEPRPTPSYAQEEPPDRETGPIEHEDDLASETLFHPGKTDPEMPPDQSADQSDPVALQDDDEIGKKIAAFEEQLGMTCPLCRNSEIETHETAKGKIYYHCTNPGCNFISWGKPYYIRCPQCSNPFLIEAADRAGKTILKCPRATCHHWQRFPWDEPARISEEGPESASASAPKKQSGRKVIKRRRRVVRRKRQG